MTLKRLIVTLGCSLMLVGCTNQYSKLDSIEFKDTITFHSYKDDYGLAVGLLNIYVVYGKYPLAANDKVPAGVCMTPQGFKKYSIRQLLVDNPDLSSTEAEKAANAQK